MRAHILCILRDARTAKGKSGCERTDELLEEIETNAMALLQGNKCIVPSKLFGNIMIPKEIVAYMSDGEDDMWFNHGSALDINIFYDGMWLFTINPVKNGDSNTEHLLESGKL